VKVVVRLRTGDAALGPVLLVFYDGDPQHGGTAFDVQQMTALRANSTYVTRVFFRAQTTGEHRIFVVAGPQTAFPAAANVALTVVQ